MRDRINYNAIFKFFLYNTAIIDLINGFIIDEIGFLSVSIGQIYRLVFLLFMIILIAKYGKKTDKLFISIVLYYFIISIIARFYWNNSFKLVIEDIVNFSKLLLIFMIVISGKVLIYRNKLIKHDLMKIINFNGFIIVGSLIVCKVFNWGSYAYLDGVGFKGYFYSNNEISIVLSLIFIYKWEEIYNHITNGKKIKFSNYINLVCIVTASIIIGAKTVYLIFIITLFTSILRTLVKIDIYKLIKMSVFIGITIIGFIVISNIFQDEIKSIIIKQQYHFKSRSFISFILSDRNILWRQLSEVVIYGKETALKVLFGFTPSFYNIELDFNALYVNYGLIGLSLVIVPIIKLLIISRKKYYNIYPYIIYILFSITAGHVVFGALAGTFFSIHCLNMIEDSINSEGGYNEDISVLSIL